MVNTPNADCSEDGVSSSGGGLRLSFIGKLAMPQHDTQRALPKIGIKSRVHTLSGEHGINKRLG